MFCEYGFCILIRLCPQIREVDWDYLSFGFSNDVFCFSKFEAGNLLSSLLYVSTAAFASGIFIGLVIGSGV